jgi:hypothetical protein
VDCHFATAEFGAVMTAIVLASAADAAGAFSPRSIVRIANGSRSNLAQIESAPGVTFTTRPLDDRGSGTMIRDCRGHQPVPRRVSIEAGPATVVTNDTGVPAILVLSAATDRIASVKLGSGRDAIEVFNSGDTGSEPWQRRFTTPPVAPGAAVTISTPSAASKLSATWLPV